MNERKRYEREKAKQLEALRAQYSQKWDEQARNAFFASMYRDLPFQIHDELSQCIIELMGDEYVLWPPEDTERLQEHQIFIDDIEGWTGVYQQTLMPLLQYIGSMAPMGGGHLYTYFGNLVGSSLVEEIITNFYDIEYPMFDKLLETFDRNVRRANGVEQGLELTKQLKSPAMLGMTTEQGILAFLDDTPFLDIFLTRVPVAIPFDLYFEHQHVCGGSGSGKSSYLAQFALEQIRHPERPSIIIVDSQDNLIPQVRRLAEIQDRVTYIDPRNPPSINLFDGGGAFDTYRYLFSTILGMELTGKQETFFKFIVRLLQEVPRATLKDLVDITVSTEKYNQYIERLPEPHRQFFENDYQQTYKDTRAQVRTRLQGILADETLFQFLWGNSTELDIQDIISNGGVLLVDTSRDALGEASSMFGKVFIFLIMKAVYGRQDRHPLFLIVDEVQEYVSSTIDTMLNQMRKFRCGCVFAHQNLNQASPELRADAWHKRTSFTQFHHSDFAVIMEDAKRGDLIYCDPPYSDSQAILYGAQMFTLERLLRTIERCKSKGVYVALSIDGTKYSGRKICNVPVPDHLFEREVFVKIGRSMLKRFQMDGRSLENHEVADRLLLTY